MGKLQDIKDEVSNEIYGELYDGCAINSDELITEVARRYAKAVAEDALKRAAESVDAGCELAVLDTEINLDL